MKRNDFMRCLWLDNLAEIQQGIEQFNALARSPGGIQFEFNAVDIGAAFALFSRVSSTATRRSEVAANHQTARFSFSSSASRRFSSWANQ
jgi:hypothetical protein